MSKQFSAKIRYFLLKGILYSKSFTGCELVSSISCHCGGVFLLSGICEQLVVLWHFFRVTPKTKN